MNTATKLVWLLGAVVGVVAIVPIGLWAYRAPSVAGIPLDSILKRTLLFLGLMAPVAMLTGFCLDSASMGPRRALSIRVRR